MIKSCIAMVCFMVCIGFYMTVLAQSPSTHIGNSDDAEAYFQQGKSLLIGGNEVQASEFFKQVISLDHTYSVKISDEYYKAGLLLIRDDKKSNIGLHYINKYLEENPDKKIDIASLLNDEGHAMSMKNKYMAHVILKRAMELNPAYERDEGFYFIYAVKTPVKPAEVIKNGEDFLSRFPYGKHVAETLYIIGQSYTEMRKPQEGRKYFKRVAESYSETEWGKKAAARLK